MIVVIFDDVSITSDTFYFKKNADCMVWWHTSLSPALRRQRQVVSSVSSRPGSTLKACLKNISKTNKTTNWKFCQLPAKNRILTWILGYNNTSKGVWRGGDYMQEEWKSSVQAQELGGESHAIQGPDLLITRSQILFLVHSKGYIYIYQVEEKIGNHWIGDVHLHQPSVYNAPVDPQFP